MTAGQKRYRVKIAIASSAGVAALIAAGGSWALWQAGGESRRDAPYPAADSAKVAGRLEGHSQRVYDALDLPAGKLVAEENVLDYSQECAPSGLKDWKWDAGEPGVAQLLHDWTLDGVREEQAQGAVRRVKAALGAEGWRVAEQRRRTSGSLSEMSVRLRGRSGDVLDVKWNSARDAVFVTVASPCAKHEPTGPDALPEPTRPR